MSLKSWRLASQASPGRALTQLGLVRPLFAGTRASDPRSVRVVLSKREIPESSVNCKRAREMTTSPRSYMSALRAPATMQIPRATRRRGPLLCEVLFWPRPQPAAREQVRERPVPRPTSPPAPSPARTLTHCAAAGPRSEGRRRDPGSRGCVLGRRAWQRGSSRARGAPSS